MQTEHTQQRKHLVYMLYRVVMPAPFIVHCEDPLHPLARIMSKRRLDVLHPTLLQIVAAHARHQVREG